MAAFLLKEAAMSFYIDWRNNPPPVNGIYEIKAIFAAIIVTQTSRYDNEK